VYIEKVHYWVFTNIKIEYPSQSYLEKALNCKISAAKNTETLAHLRKLAGPDGIDQVLDRYQLDAVASLADSPISSVASAAGKFLQDLTVSKNQSETRLKAILLPRCLWVFWI
jgi:hypothetical protein